MLYGLSKPEKSDLYTNDIDNIVSGEANNQSLYSNYCFYGVKSINIDISNLNSSNVKVILRKYTWYGQTSVHSYTITGDSSLATEITGLDSKTYYFFEFVSPCNIYGTVQGNS